MAVPTNKTMSNENCSTFSIDESKSSSLKSSLTNFSSRSRSTKHVRFALEENSFDAFFTASSRQLSPASMMKASEFDLNDNLTREEKRLVPSPTSKPENVFVAPNKSTDSRKYSPVAKALPELVRSPAKSNQRKLPTIDSYFKKHQRMSPTRKSSTTSENKSFFVPLRATNKRVESNRTGFILTSINSNEIEPKKRQTEISLRSFSKVQHQMNSTNELSNVLLTSNNSGFYHHLLRPMKGNSLQMKSLRKDLLLPTIFHS